MNNGCLQYVYDTKLDMFAHLHAHPPIGPQFDDHMGGYRQGRPSWMTEGYYPVKERLIAGADSSPTAPFLIDIGGGKGQDLDEFLRRIPDYPGRLILQDLPRVITQITDLDPKIDRMEHDFYQEQPVKGTYPKIRINLGKLRTLILVQQAPVPIICTRPCTIGLMRSASRLLNRSSRP